MKSITLDDRLSCVAGFVRNGAALADIGTDHALLCVYLAQHSIITSALACDINEGPLQSAVKNIRSNGLESTITVRLSDGLDKVLPDECSDIVIAGMGGELTADIMKRCGWLKNKRYNIILQPMSKADKLRTFLCENGYKTIDERAVTADGKCYAVMNVQYNGDCFTPNGLYTQLGLIAERFDDNANQYKRRVWLRLNKQLEGINAGGGNAESLRLLAKEVESTLSSTSTVGNIFDYIDRIAPFNTQLPYDNSGLLIGSRSQEAVRIGFCLDITRDIIDQAISLGCTLIVSHHPVIFEPVSKILDSSLPFELARHNISAICAHTSYDAADGGVNDCLCEQLELINIRKVENEEFPQNSPICRIGEYSEALTVRQLAAFIKQRLGCNSVRFNLPDKMVKTVGVCSGSGADTVAQLCKSGADVVVTGDIKHHGWCDFNTDGFAVIDAGHYRTEYLSMQRLAQKTAEHFKNASVFELKQTDPFEEL